MRAQPMTAWHEIEQAEPGFAQRVRARFDAHRHKTIATLRADGSPRISEIETVFENGELVSGSVTNARKGADLRRDPRFALHSPASISKAIMYLENQGLVRRERDERRRDRYVVDDDVWYQARIAGAQANNLVIQTARHGVGILGPDTPAAARLLEDIARFLVSESITRAAEQAREVLNTRAEATTGDTAKPSSDR